MPECKYCGETRTDVKYLRVHMTWQHKDEIATTVPCNWCGADIEVKEWEIDDRHYCSRECSKAWNSYIRSGERSPLYKHGKSRGRRYEYFSDLIRFRDDNRCLRCGATVGASDGRQVHTHHLIPEDDGGGIFDPCNVISLCNACHRKLEGEQIDEQLSQCGITSVGELEFGERLSDRFESYMKQKSSIRNAPPPRPGMFAEAQQLVNSRERTS